MSLTLWCPLLPYGYSCFIYTGTYLGLEHPVPDLLAVICNFWHPGTMTLSTEHQSARMSKSTNNSGINPVCHRMLYSCSHIATVGIKGLIKPINTEKSCGWLRWRCDSQRFSAAENDSSTQMIQQQLISLRKLIHNHKHDMNTRVWPTSIDDLHHVNSSHLFIPSSLISYGSSFP